MAKQGEAFVRVRADLEPYGKDLDRGLKTITDKFEKALNRRFGRSLGTNVGAGVRDGLIDSSKGIGKDLDRELGPASSRTRGRRVGQNIAAGIGDGMSDLGPVRKSLAIITSTIEDGFSALPAEVKAVVGGLIVAAVIPATALLTAAVGAAILAGVSGLGVALASQFDSVQAKFESFVDRARILLVRTAEPFEGAILQALDTLQGGLYEIEGDLESLFANAAQYLDPFARGLVSLVEGVVEGLNRGFEGADLDGLVFALEDGFKKVGVAIGEAFDVILTNPDLDEGLESLFTVIAGGIKIIGEFTSFTLSAFRVLQDAGRVIFEIFDGIVDVARLIGQIGKAQPDFKGPWKDLTGGINDQDEATYRLIKSRERLAREGPGQIALTEEQTKAIEEQAKALTALNRVLDEQLDLANDLISTQIDYQESLEETVGALKKNGADLRLNTKIGKENRRNIQETINDLKAEVRARVEAGELSNDAAQRLYDNEIARLKEEFRLRGGNIKQFDEIFGKLIMLQGAPPVPDKLGPFGLSLQNSLNLLANIQAAVNALAKAPSVPKITPGVGITGAGAGQQKYEDGGFINEPTVAMMGEGYKREVVLPLTQPRRSMQLLAQSPLAGMLAQQPVVNVYVGNEQLESRMFQVASSFSRGSARTLSQVPRMV